MKFFSRCANPLCVTAVHHVYDCLCVWIVASPIWPDACLTTQVPHLELDVFVCHRLYIEANSCKMFTTVSARSCDASMEGFSCSNTHSGWSTPPLRPAAYLQAQDTKLVVSPDNLWLRFPAAMSGKQRLHKIVVFPALSSPSTSIRASFSPNRARSFDIHSPMPASCSKSHICMVR